jgi:hypothetical protein
MKRRKFIATRDAFELQKRISASEDERRRKMLESSFTKTYLESWVNLDNNKATLLCTKDRVSDVVKGHIEDMVKSIMITYSKIDRVNIYGYSETIKSIKSGELKFALKSSIIRPKIVGESSDIPLMIANDINKIQYDKDTEENVGTFLDLRDNIFQKMGFEPTLTPSEDQEAGEIRINRG